MIATIFCSIIAFLSFCFILARAQAAFTAKVDADLKSNNVIKYE